MRYLNEWRMKMNAFDREVKLIENQAKLFIDDSFKTLRSAEGAFNMLQNFKNIRSREAIKSQMMVKFKEILATFCREGRRKKLDNKYYLSFFSSMQSIRCFKVRKTVRPSREASRPSAAQSAGRAPSSIASNAPYSNSNP